MMRRLLLFLAFLPTAALAQPVTTTSGEQKQLCRVWDGTDVALVDGSGNMQVAGTLTCNAGSGTLAISATQLPAALGANGALKIEGVASGTVVPISGTVTITDGAGAVNVIVDSGTIAATQGGAWNITNVSGTVSLPTGASTAAKQPALGTAGTASADVITVQGITSGTPLSTSASIDRVLGSATASAGIAGVLGVGGVEATGDTAIAFPLGVGGEYNTTPPTVTDGTRVASQYTARGEAHTVIRDAAGNARGANVSGSGALNVTCDNCGGSTFADDDAFTGGTTPVVNIGALYDTTPPAITDGSAGIPRMNSSRALLVDGSGVTQPVSGTFWQATQPVSGTVAATQSGAWSLSANQSTNVAQVAGTTTDTNSGTKSAGTLRVVLATDQPALTNKLLVTPDSVALPANQSVNVAQMNGVATTMGNGADGTGVQRVTIANNSTGIIALTTGAAQIGHLEANQSVNLAQVAGATTATGNGTASGSVRVSVASDSTGSLIATSATAANFNNRPDTSGATGAAPPARADYVGGLASGATGGFLTGFAVCDTFVNVNVSTATTTALVTGVSGRHVRICSLSLVTAAANNVALISGTGATCGTGTTGMNGGTTSASGWNFAANGGITQGSGLGAINQTNATGDSVCVITSAATQLSGRISYTIY